MVNAVVGKKIQQTQRFLEDGTRIPVTVVHVPSLPIMAVKTTTKHGYNALQVAFGTKKVKSKKKTGGDKTAPLFLREIRVMDEGASEDSMPKVGDSVTVSDVLAAGDMINVTGVSKGKGYAGGVKRHNFKGGPRTHGQSDRERAPGSIGQTTTPGRVYRGKRMAGHMGVATTTLKNLLVVGVEGDKVLIKGLVPGSLNTLVAIKKVGEFKKFIPLFAEVEEQVVEEAAPEAIVEEAEVEIKEEAQPEAAQETQGPEEVKVEEKQEVPAEEPKTDEGESK